MVVGGWHPVVLANGLSHHKLDELTVLGRHTSATLKHFSNLFSVKALQTVVGSAIMESRPVKCLDPPSLGPPHPSGLFANITVVPIGEMNLVTFAGQLGITPTGHIPSTLPEQIEQCLSNIAKCLETVDWTVYHLVRLAY